MKAESTTPIEAPIEDGSAPNGMRLPEALPAGERILWQAVPDWKALARDAYWTRAVALYFGALVAWQGFARWQGGGGPAEISGAIAWAALPAALCLGLLAGLAWLQARSTLYTVTEKRISMQIGVAIPLAINVPLSQVLSADLIRRPGARSEITLTLDGGPGLGFWVLWPHARPGRGREGTRLALRGLAEPEAVASLLAELLAGTVSRPAAPLLRVPRRAPRSGPEEVPLPLAAS